MLVYWIRFLFFPNIFLHSFYCRGHFFLGMKQFSGDDTEIDNSNFSYHFLLVLSNCSLLLFSFFLPCKVLSLTSFRNTRQIPITRNTDKAWLTNLTSVKKRRFVFQCLFVFCLDCTRFYLLPYETCTILIISSFEVSICYGRACQVSLMFSKKMVIRLFFIYSFTAAILLSNPVREISLTTFLCHSILQILLHKISG